MWHVAKLIHTTYYLQFEEVSPNYDIAIVTYKNKRHNMHLLKLDIGALRKSDSASVP